jgi:hypothetical protein
VKLWPLIFGGVALGIAASVYKGAPAAVREKLSTLGPEFDNLHPDVRAKALRVLDEANKHFEGAGLRVGIHDGWRDVEESKANIVKGVSALRDPYNSYHVWGLAVDFVFLTKYGAWTWLPDPANPKNTAYRDKKWYELGEIIERNGFEWGGRWNSFDGPHAQLPIAKPVALRVSYGDPQKYIETFNA